MSIEKENFESQNTEEHIIEDIFGNECDGEKDLVNLRTNRGILRVCSSSIEDMERNGDFIKKIDKDE